MTEYDLNRHFSILLLSKEALISASKVSSQIPKRKLISGVTVGKAEEHVTGTCGTRVQVEILTY